MKRGRYIRHERSTGRMAGVRGLVFMICTAVLSAMAGSLFAVGTGVVDQVTGWFPAGTNLTIVATPHEYSVFDRWDGATNGAAVSTNTIQFSVLQSKSITAVFRDRLTASNSVPYWWLASVGITNDFENAANDDPDDDDFTTAQEYWAGTDPTNSDSLLQIDQILVTSTNVRLVWAHARVDDAIPPISIQRRASLITGDWEHVWAHSPTNGINTWENPLPDNAFFRLCVTNMP